MKFNIPNIISWIRILIVPFFFYLLVWGDKGSVEIACILYFFASASDFFDGWVARKYGEVSNFGKFLDPLADKILTTAAFIAFVLLGIVELWMVLIIVFRDFGTTLLRIYFDNKGKTFKTSLAAKWKTTLQMIFIAFILLLLLLKETVTFTEKVLGTTADKIETLLFSDIIYFAMLLIVILSVWTGIEYFLPNNSPKEELKT
ncbi:MAG: CDP-diacylglycerol--glycerol-3-phosphate 3-phosphatidyltransferase [bacterium]